MESDESIPCPGGSSIRIDARNVAAGSDLPMIAYLAEANEVREGDGHWECWDEDEPCDSGGSCGKCVVKVLSGADHLSPQTPREQHTIAKLNQQAFDGQLEEARCRLSCQARCRGAVEIERVEIERTEVLAARPHTDKMDERTLLQGLIVMFQRALSASIKRELYGCAQRLANKLNLKPVRSCGVIPDFCKGDAILSRYFQIVEELRHVCWRKRVQAMPDFQRIEAVMASPLFGLRTSRSDSLTMACRRCGPLGFAHKQQLGRPQDALDRAVIAIGRDTLAQSPGTAATCSITELTTSAQSIAVEADDVSLVGLAARIGDPMLMILARAQPRAGHLLDDSGEEFDWQVDAAFAASAAEFVDTANQLLGADLPAPTADHASAYFWASLAISPGGQCVPLDCDHGQGTYYWAIRGPHLASRMPGPEAEQFVDTKPWDSGRYTRELYPRGWLDESSPYHRQRAKCACGSGRRYENCHGLEEGA